MLLFLSKRQTAVIASVTSLFLFLPYFDEVYQTQGGSNCGEINTKYHYS